MDSRRRFRVELVGRIAEELLLCTDELLFGHAALLDLGLFLLAILPKILVQDSLRSCGMQTRHDL